MADSSNKYVVYSNFNTHSRGDVIELPEKRAARLMDKGWVGEYVEAEPESAEEVVEPSGQQTLQTDPPQESTSKPKTKKGES